MGRYIHIDEQTNRRTDRQITLGVVSDPKGPFSMFLFLFVATNKTLTEQKAGNVDVGITVEKIRLSTRRSFVTRRKTSFATSTATRPLPATRRSARRHLA